MARNRSFDHQAFARYYLGTGILVLTAIGFWSINALSTITPDLFLTTTIGTIIAFGSAGFLAFLSTKEGVFTRSK